MPGVQHPAASRRARGRRVARRSIASPDVVIMCDGRRKRADPVGARSETAGVTDSAANGGKTAGADHSPAADVGADVAADSGADSCADSGGAAAVVTVRDRFVAAGISQLRGPSGRGHDRGRGRAHPRSGDAGAASDRGGDHARVGMLVGQRVGAVEVPARRYSGWAPRRTVPRTAPVNRR